MIYKRNRHQSSWYHIVKIQNKDMKLSQFKNPLIKRVPSMSWKIRHSRLIVFLNSFVLFQHMEGDENETSE